MRNGPRWSRPRPPWRDGGCGSDDSGGGGEEIKAPEGPKALTKLGEGEGEVNLIAWAGYVEDGSTDPKVDWVTDFEKETGASERPRSATRRTRWSR